MNFAALQLQEYGFSDADLARIIFDIQSGMNEQKDEIAEVTLPPPGTPKPTWIVIRCRPERLAEIRKALAELPADCCEQISCSE